MARTQASATQTFFVAALLTLALVPATAQQKQGIRAVDFRNFSYYPEDGGDEEGRLILRKGQYREEQHAGLFVTTKLVAVKYADFDGDGQEEAAVQINAENSGSMGWSEDYYVFGMRGGKPKQIFYQNRPRGKEMRVEGKSLVIVAPHWTDRDASCCPSFVATETYHWRGKGFVRTGNNRARIARR